MDSLNIISIKIINACALRYNDKIFRKKNIQKVYQSNGFFPPHSLYPILLNKIKKKKKENAILLNCGFQKFSSSLK